LTNGQVPVELGDNTWPNTRPQYNWCHQSTGWEFELSEFCISLPTSCWCYRWPGRGHNPHYWL